ncbi:MAG TPA: serine/threonine-protein kinase, partial [Kofleriaceae bacterium]|nr:serine/threonine-protein kinase [Kofleriaceae bacterium]
MLERSVPVPYELVRPLGQGGFGEVFLVRDPQRGDVALKRLLRVDPASIARFKNEFRLLQGIRNPALATLFELTKIEDGWYLLMEYVAGDHFTSWVRPGGDGFSSPTMPDVGNQTVPSIAGAGGPAFDEARLRDALRRLAGGLVALHEGGLIHRDLKPSNVLVKADGRVVILDFGLAAAPVGDSHQSIEAKLMGTPGYIAPEQARAMPITRAVDWYAVGVMLFEALTGRRPYIGSVRDILEAQLGRTPPDPGAFGRQVPDDLRTLCMRLLAAEPTARPDGPEVLAALGGAPVTVATPRPLFVGRSVELDVIASSLDALAGHGPSVVHVVAPSGFGKSALLVRALADARERTAAVVLAGRCYEREAVPFKAIDPLIDALADHLRRQSPEDVLGVMPRDAFALCRMFPALGQVDELARAPDPEKVENPEEIRRRAVLAMRDMLARIADRKPLVLAIDDLQWGCLDSARLLADLLAPPSAPRLLLLLCHRPQEHAPSSAVATLRARLDASGIIQRTVSLGPLAASDAE